MDSQYKLLSELLSDQAAFITSPKTSFANYWGALPPCPPPVSTDQDIFSSIYYQIQYSYLLDVYVKSIIILINLFLSVVKVDIHFKDTVICGYKISVRHYDARE